MKRTFIAIIAALLVAIPAWFSNANAESNKELALKITPQEQFLGEADAPIEIIEYASMTCPHCAHFHMTVLPEIEKEFIDTGKVKFVTRDLPWDPLAFAVSKINHCSGDNYYQMLGLFMNTQKSWAASKDALKEIKKVARMGGMNSAQVDACLDNEEIHKLVNYSRGTALEILKVKGTPTLFINGEMFVGAPEIDAIREKINSILKNDK